MEPIGLTEGEIKLALSIGGKGETWTTFFRFVASEIIRSENSINIPLEEDHRWEAWYLSFISRSLLAFASLEPFLDIESPTVWLKATTHVTQSSRKFVSSIAIAVREKQVAIAKQQEVAEKTSSDADPPDYSSSATPSSSTQGKTSAGKATTGNPRPPIRFRTIRQRPGSDEPSDTVYLYFHSPPPLQSFLQGLRKRYELRAGDKITSLRVKVPYVRILVMIGEEQEEWDWEGALEDASGHGDRATIVFEVQSE